MYLRLLDALKLKRPGLTVAVMSCGNLMQFQDACNMFAGPISSQEYGIGMEPKKGPSLFSGFHIGIIYDICIILYISYYLQYIYIIFIYLFIVYHLASYCHILSIIVLLMRIQSVGHGSHSFTQKKSTGPVLRRGFWPIAFAKEAPPQHMGISRNEGRAMAAMGDPKGSSAVVFTGKSSGFVVPPRSTSLTSRVIFAISVVKVSC
jgi:hypothetical protein